MRLAVNKVHALISLASHADLTNHTVDHFQYHEPKLVYDLACSQTLVCMAGNKANKIS